MRWEEQTAVPVPAGVRDRLADYRDERGHGSYAAAINALLDAQGGIDD